jgi:hypothetical protein
MYKNILLVACLALFTTTCSQKTGDNTAAANEEKPADSISEEDENNAYELNAEVTSTKNWDLLIPDGYVLLEKYEGDINKDGISDLVLVVKSQQENDDEPLGEDAPGRILRLLVKDSYAFYSIAAESNTAILAKNEGGASSDDPFQQIVIEPGQFTISQMGGATERWSYDHTFTYDKQSKAWFLSKIVTGSFDADDPTNDTNIIETPKKFGKVNFVDFKGI